MCLRACTCNLPIKNSLTTIKNIFECYTWRTFRILKVHTLVPYQNIIHFYHCRYCDQNHKAIQCLCNMHQEHLGSHHHSLIDKMQIQTEACQLASKHSWPYLQDLKSLLQAFLQKAERRRQVSATHFLFQKNCIQWSWKHLMFLFPNERKFLYKMPILERKFLWIWPTYDLFASF